MPQIVRKQAGILDRKAMAERLAVFQARAGTGAGRLSPEALAFLRDCLAAGRSEIERRFYSRKLREDAGLACVAEQAFLMDGIVAGLFRLASEEVFPPGADARPEELAVVAVGGYGRAELAPFSDIDLLFLTPPKPSPRIEQLVEFMLYALWDLGLKLGHAVRSLAQSVRDARNDMTIRTTLLETRLIAGDRRLFRELGARIRRDVIADNHREFIHAKLAERDERHTRQGDSRYMLEPNLKDGKGGLRDLHSLFWIAGHVYGETTADGLCARDVLNRAEADQLAAASAFYARLRCMLHYQAGRGEDRLTFDLQAQCARALGFLEEETGTNHGVEAMMKRYFNTAREVGNLTRIFCLSIEADLALPLGERIASYVSSALRFQDRLLEGLPVVNGLLDIPAEDHFRKNPLDLIRVFHISHFHGVDLHPRCLRAMARSLRLIGPALRNDAGANRLFVDLLCARKNPAPTLRRMNDAGVLGRFMPDFGRVGGQMQFDMYHVFTVDEHSINAISILNDIENGLLADEVPLASEFIHKVVSRKVLYVAVFLHDIAKGRRGDHSVLGEKVARKLCPRLGLDEAETETVAWLVRWHLAMTFCAFKRDLEDDRLIGEFVELVQSPERLRLLLVLTVADIRAVGPGRWNNWKATLLRELYWRAEDFMNGSGREERHARRLAELQEDVRAALLERGMAEADVAAWTENADPAYWLAFDRDALLWHADEVRALGDDEAPVLVTTRNDEARAATEVMVWTVDHHGLFSRLSGGIAAAGGNIVDARIFTFRNGMALDVFMVQNLNGRPLETAQKRRRLADMVRKAVTGEIDVAGRIASAAAEPPARLKVLPVAPRVLIDNAASSTFTVIEVNGRDRPGLLWRVAACMSELSLQISLARISTYGQKVVDVFYVKDIFGLKIIHPDKQARIRAKLLEALADPGDDDKQPARRPDPLHVAAAE